MAIVKIFGKPSKEPAVCTYTYAMYVCTLSSWSERIEVGNADSYILLLLNTFDLDTRPIYYRWGSGVIVHCM